MTIDLSQGSCRDKDGRRRPLTSLPSAEQARIRAVLERMLPELDEPADAARERALEENRRRSEVLSRSRPRL